jgi:hypothetical protein
MSSGLVAFQQSGQTQVIKSHLHSGGSVVHLAHLPVGKYVEAAFIRICVALFCCCIY